MAIEKHIAEVFLMKYVLVLLTLSLVVVVNPLWAETAKTAADTVKTSEKLAEGTDTKAVDDSGSRSFTAKPVIEKNRPEEQEWFDKAYQASLAGKYDEAIEYYKKAIGINPDFAAAHANLGVTYMNKGRLKEALVTLQKALALDAQNAGAQYNLGLVYDKMGKLDEAILAYEQSIAINPRFARAYQNLGIAYFDKNLKPMAAECFYKAALLFDKQGETGSALKAYDALTLTESKELEQALSEKLFPEQHQKNSP
jgi:tetratricopeptide (TPR) repeat protein